MMLMCGIVSAAGIGAVSAATPDEDVLSVTVHYKPQNLNTDDGARALYRRLVNAAVEVCPADSSSPHWISEAVQQCREQSVARAVHKINSPKLVAVYSTSSKHG
jgi:UrcA family protein